MRKAIITKRLGGRMVKYRDSDDKMVSRVTVKGNRSCSFSLKDLNFQLDG